MEFDKLEQLLERNRTYRRFDNALKIDKATLLRLVNLTRYCASGRNLQPLKYRLVIDPLECEAVFEALAWAGYFKDWDGPEPAERPTAYLVQCLDESIAANCLCDDGLQLEAITLGATALGLGCCIVKSFNRKQIIDSLAIPSTFSPRYVVALGYPVEKCVIEEMSAAPDASVIYYRDSDGVHHVPKRPLSQLLIDAADEKTQ